MGTTQRIIPGVTGEPNWKDLSLSITHIAKTVEKERKDEENSDENKTPEQLTSEYRLLINRRNTHLKNALSSLIKTGGNSKKISSGKSKTIGKAGIKTSRKLIGFFTDVNTYGLQPALKEIGFGSLEGKSVQDIIDYLLVYCSDSSVGMDETASNKASCEVLNQIADESNNDLEGFENLLKDYLNGNKLIEFLCNFWGLYIFEHLSERFEERITQLKGDEVCKETFQIIKEDILGQIRVLNEKRPVTNIDWKGEAGNKEIEEIFESVIKLFE